MHIAGKRKFPIPSVAIVLFALLLLSFAGCAPSEKEAEFLARRAFLLRQNQGIRELIVEAERGSLVPKDRFLIGIDEKVVGDLFTSQLPLERPLGKHFVIRLESALVQFSDKFGVITIEGNVHRPSTPDRRTAVRVHGGLGAVEIDPRTDMLNIRIAIDHLEVLEAGILERALGRAGKKFVAQKGRELLQEALPALQVPVGLGREIRLPAIQEGAIELDSLVVPLDLSVERVIAARKKLWVTLNAEVGTVVGSEEGLGVSVGKKPRTGGAKAPTPTRGGTGR